MPTFILILLFSLSSVSAVTAAALTADEIAHRANQTVYYQGQDGKAKVNMAIIDSQNRVRKRQLTILRLDAAKTDELTDAAYWSDQKFYVYFHRPADVAKMSLLVWKHLDRDDDRWLYLPALDLVKRIGATDQRTGFAGSDFFYEDVSGRHVNADTHELVEVTASHYRLRNSPKAPETVAFSYYEMLIDKITFIPTQVEYFDRTGKKYRVAKALAVKTIQGHPTVVKAMMTNLETGSKTVMAYSKVEYDKGIEDRLFTERYLRKAPKKQLR